PPDPAEEQRVAGPSAKQRRRRRRGDRDVRVAVAAGTFLTLLFLVTLFTHPAAFAALVTFLILVGIGEAAAVCRERGVHVAVPVILVAALIFVVGAYRAGTGGLVVGLVTLFLLAVAWELADPQRTDVFRTIAATVMLGLWVPFLGSFAVVLAVRGVDGWVAVLATVGAAVVSDVGAYVVGTSFGRRQVAPSVSPGKTWEGVVGGMAVAGVVAAVALPLLGTGELFDPVTAFLFAVIVAAVGVLGDLTESLLKRDLGVKDFGRIIPGHGGVLDRIDSLLFALPAGYYALILVG
ncbi:MAG: phosphatidate cytidylyltransferase, partial [Actinomycetota bacterium]|nr:phosphatidate cytidylyltransferase [Actinomycetota bacterium]